MTKKEQITQAFRKLISGGHWAINESVGNLQLLEKNSEELFGVRASFGTIRSAEQILVEEGILSPILAGVPTRVIAIPKVRDEDTVLLTLQELDRRIGEIQMVLRNLISGLNE